MDRSQRIRTRDTLALLRLQAELSTLSPLSETWKQRALQGLMRLVPAKFAVYTAMDQFRVGRDPTLSDAAVCGSISDEAMGAMHAWFNRAGMMRSHPLFQALMGTSKRSFAFRRVEKVEDRDWFTSDVVNQEFVLCEVQDNLAGIYRFDGTDRTYGFGLHRHPSDPGFSLRDRAIVHLLTSALQPVFRAHAEMTQQPKLSPRLQQTLRALLAGDSEKQIACRLGLSRHTVHDYVKTLYRHFEVATRAELIVRCLAPEREADAFDRSGERRK